MYELSHRPIEFAFTDPEESNELNSNSTNGSEQCQ